jgi:hypothetical protein
MQDFIASYTKLLTEIQFSIRKTNHINNALNATATFASMANFNSNASEKV